jgi:hypothetical protein
MLDQLLPFLSTLGPWGIVAGAIATVVVQRLREKFKPSDPKPVDPSKPVEPSNTPILDALLALIRAKLQKKPVQSFQSLPEPVDADIDPEDAEKLIDALR